MTEFRDIFLSHAVYVIFRKNGVIVSELKNFFVRFWEAKLREQQDTAKSI